MSIERYDTEDMGWSDSNGSYVRYLDHIAEVERLMSELEHERLRLAACGVVAMTNIPETASIVRNMDPSVNSASCSDVAAAVDREIRLRSEVERLKALVRSAYDEGHADCFVSEDPEKCWSESATKMELEEIK